MKSTIANKNAVQKAENIYLVTITIYYPLNSKQMHKLVVHLLQTTASGAVLDAEATPIIIAFMIYKVNVTTCS